MFSNFDFSVIPASLPFIGEGFLFSLNLTLVAMSVGIVLGTLLALARLHGSGITAALAATYVNAMRSIPLTGRSSLTRLPLPRTLRRLKSGFPNAAPAD